ncbi:siderophore biosynthesis protein SbnG [Pseudomonas syringae pv. tomato]|uniref:Siderophore biosynthesis protein SbnG n=4 Tax=Pseudomonas TaxID=286 RepID=A0AB36KPM2_PSEUB|nr:siderophore biosynthesis protein SbnG [Pseudomonas syringae pv. tomato]POQ03810.1 siderophore biosynthesis protein SbnG [Pseudomonas syringae pv. avii]RMO88977.1 Achromobactin biosynthetic protein AcsB [Pseudomonas syringae pv. maculicola]RMR18530.1 Achromobactin biosynthetic protein AcsB [Pseudomonas syringae pv. persicae]RMU93614.1 Achromobactin biosynthetic protein AcsB [Pseudomonas syringae pv. tomato]
MMLRTNALKGKLGSGQPVYGLISSIPAPAAIELIAEAGFDFVIIDMEHVLINPETVENMIRVAESYGLTPLVRVADLNPKTLLRLLDGGAQGIVLPMIERPEQLADAIAACKYHPLGRRSLNAGRPGSFGKHSLAQYVEAANQQIMVVAMIESAEGVRRAAEIAAVAGLDMILEGAADLSQSLGMPWQIDQPEVQQALYDTWQAAQAAGVAYCTIPRQPGDAARWQARGVNAFVLGDERGIAFRALQARLNHISAEGK